jgi:signal transduction histidine kinase
MTLDQTSEQESDVATAGDNRALVAAYEAALAVASEINLEAVLQRIIDLAREVVPARYAALGVANQTGKLEQFLVSGISDEVRENIGPLPEGHGLLGTLIREGKPLLVPDISADPRSVGFPPYHPPMRSLLGAPILLGSRTLGNLYLTERLDGQPFDERDLASLQILAAHAATAIDRAQLYRQIEASGRRAEEQRDQLRVILDNLPSGVLIHAVHEGVELANESAVRMLLGDGSPGGTLPVYGRDYRLLRADGTPLTTEERPAQRALRGEAVRNQQASIERPDGTRLPVLAQAAPLRSADGAVNRAVIVYQDITQLRQGEQLKDDFLSLISHEFRTPLTAIHGGAHLLSQQGEELDPDTRREILADVVTESGRLDRMLANMLKLAETMAGRLNVITEPVLIAPLARRVTTEVAARAPNHSFAVDVPDSLPPAEGDPELIEQILRNLYENAIKYSPNGGEIRTSAAGDGELVRIEVADQGTGIAPEHVPHLFQRFRRPGADPTVRGMGLGLYLSRLLVEAQGGGISAQSEGAGKGSTFAIELPVAQGWTSEADGASGRFEAAKGPSATTEAAKGPSATAEEDARA